MIDKYQLIFFGGNNKSRQNELNFHDGPEIISFLAYVHWSWIDLLSGGEISRIQFHKTKNLLSRTTTMNTI